LYPCPNTSIALIAGGRSSRFGSNKLLHPFRGKPVIQWVIEAAREVSDSLFLVSRLETTDLSVRFPFLGVIPDIEGYEGPLAGVAAALSYATRPRVLVLAADLPLLRGAMLRALLEAAPTAPAAAPMIEGILQPLCAVYDQALAGLAVRRLAQGQRAVHAFFEAAQGIRLAPEQLGPLGVVSLALRGVNTRQELAAQEKVTPQEEIP
jgi:molybdopterin-guanine dinucleotide biosynthesis protein A